MDCQREAIHQKNALKPEQVVLILLLQYIQHLSYASRDAFATNSLPSLKENKKATKKKTTGSTTKKTNQKTLPLSTKKNPPTTSKNVLVPQI